MHTSTTPPRNFKLSSPLALLLAILLVALITGALYARKGIGSSAAAVAATPVMTTAYHLQDHFVRSSSYLGQVRAANRADLGFELPGRLATLDVREGSRVAAGDILATLDSSALLAQQKATAAELKQAQAELEFAQLKWDRQQDLRKTGATSKQALDEARLQAQALGARVEAVSAALASIAINLDKNVLRAPFNGVIANRYLDQGTVITAGVPVLRLIATGSREAHIGIPVERLASLVAGSAYTLHWRDQQISAPLRSIRPDVDPVTRTATAVFSLPPNSLALDGEVISLAVQETIDTRGGWIPISALLEGQRGVWNVQRIEQSGDHNVTARAVVEVLEIQGNQAYVAGTLHDGDLLVADGIHRIATGAHVAPTEH